MTKKHVEQLNSLITPATSGRFANAELICKHFFSGAAFYANGRICITFSPAGLALKLPEDSRNKLIKQNGAKHLQYFPKAPIKKEYVVLPKSMLKDTRTIWRWIRASINYALEDQ
ncbi:MAG: TfoX/Sxy family protein [Anaerolineales bacterium]